MASDAKLCVGARCAARFAASPKQPESLQLLEGEVFTLEYVGSTATRDEGWCRATSLLTGNSGWIPSWVVLPLLERGGNSEPPRDLPPAGTGPPAPANSEDPDSEVGSEEEDEEPRAEQPRGPVNFSVELQKLALAVLSIENPQHEVKGRPGEAQLQDFVCHWLRSRRIPFQQDPRWGVHATLQGAAPGKGAVLLAAHLDSDALDLPIDSLHLDGPSNVIRHRKMVGLDCKCGVIMALSVLDRLWRGGEVRGVQLSHFSVHILFTVGEESGQKGAQRLPFRTIFQGVRHVLVLDRMTQGAGAPKDTSGRCLRHCVTEYKGVPLLQHSSSTSEILSLLQRSTASLPGAAPGHFSGVVSPNCADALEYRARWDAEVAAPLVLQLLLRRQPSERLQQVLQKVEALSAEILRRLEQLPPEERVSSMYAPPRKTRYEALAELYRLLYADCEEVPEELKFDVVNLSYNYDEADGCLQLAELEETIQIVLGFLALHFGPLS